MARVSREVIRIMLIRNELGGVQNSSWAYQLRNAGTLKSGYSFGQPQWDLANYADGRATFEDILTNATYDNKLNEADINRIMEIVAIKNENLTTALNNELGLYMSRIYSALSSEYGIATIDAKFETYIDEKLSRLDSMISELRAYSDQLRASGNIQEADRVKQRADCIDNNQVLQMDVIDYDNQLGIDGINTDGNYKTTDDGQLLQYFKDGETTINNGTLVTIDGDLDMVDYLRFIFNTQHGYNSLKDVLRRQSNIIDEAAKNGMWGDDLTDLNILISQAYKVFGSIKDLFSRNKAINGLLDRYYTQGQQWRASSDPLTLDLDGDGIETVGINTNNPILFDHNADGVKTATGWVKGDDGLLVLDRNNNGVIDNGKELFGDSTPLSAGGNAADGFAALADLDSNGDKVIDANDAQFANLKVWRDLNQDGVSQADELSTLEQQNIALPIIKYANESLTLK